MANIKDIVAFCDDSLSAEYCEDYCPNGLQVQGKTKVSKIVSGVTASQEMIAQAAANKADLLLVHHGYFWKGEAPQIIGMKYHRIKALLDNNINLLAYHLPLDMHNKLGNNAYLGNLLGIDTSSGLADYLSAADKLGFVAKLPKPLSAVELTNLLSAKLGRQPRIIAGRPDHQEPIETIAWCSGAAQDMIELAYYKGAQCYLSGESSERTFHFAKEHKIDYYEIGHHASEVGGVQLLGAAIAAEFAIEHQFVDMPNPI